MTLPSGTRAQRALHRLVLAAALSFGLSGYKSVESLFAPSAELWERWTAHDPRSSQGIDHSAWDKILARYLQTSPGDINRFSYGAVTASDREALDGYLNALSATAVSGYARNEQYAFWINLYNALTVDVVLDHYPVDSIRDIDISPGLFADGPWDKELIEVEGEALTLNDIEHRILRPIWREPRTHYAVNCASNGCPNLLPRAFTAANTEELLSAAAADYVNHPRGVSVSSDRITVSKIYDWFGEDFGGDETAILNHLLDHASPDLAARIRAVGKIHDTAYDWALNAAE